MPVIAAQKSAEGIVGGVIHRRPERKEVESSDACLDVAMQQNTGSVRPSARRERVKPEPALLEGTEAMTATRAMKSRRPNLLREVRRSIRRTAVYGPVRTVVGEGWSREASPYPDVCRA
jgi:hypothetical protein